ncbi:MAG: 5-deoxy-glucuronate isomerase, partial [Candidatus Thiodiazotropha sp.]
MADLLCRVQGDHGKVHEITPRSAQWKYVGFNLYRLNAGESCSELTGDREVILVLVEGKARIDVDGERFGEIGERMNVFEKKPPHCVYVPGSREWKADATTDCTLGVCSAPYKGGHKAALIDPTKIQLMERGKGTNKRYINNIAMENDDVADSLLVTEVYTP